MVPTHVRAAACLCGLVLLVASQSRAEILVEYTFGYSPGSATNAPESVAANLSATPLIAMNHETGRVVPHSFVEWSTGDMAMRMIQGDGGTLFRFELESACGFTFQVTDAAFTYRHSNTYGGARDIVVRPNGGPDIGWYNLSGGDITAAIGPGSPGWVMSSWNPFIQRTDPRSLLVNFSLIGNDSSTTSDLNYVRISGNVLPAPVVPGDLDCDADVDLADLALLLAGFGCAGGGCAGDIDGDGDTDLSDLTLLLAHFGEGP